MDQQIAQQIGIGVLALVLGISGWLLPYKYNLLRLRKGFQSLASEGVNRAIPKILGSILILAGITLLIGTGAVGKFR